MVSIGSSAAPNGPNEPQLKPLKPFLALQYYGNIDLIIHAFPMKLFSSMEAFYVFHLFVQKPRHDPNGFFGEQEWKRLSSAFKKSMRISDLFDHFGLDADCLRFGENKQWISFHHGFPFIDFPFDDVSKTDPDFLLDFFVNLHSIFQLYLPSGETKAA
jgi:hypothetical protein